MDFVENQSCYQQSIRLSARFLEQKKRFVRYLQTFRFSKGLLPLDYDSVYIHNGVSFLLHTYHEWRKRIYKYTNAKNAICEYDIVLFEQIHVLPTVFQPPILNHLTI